MALRLTFNRLRKKWQKRDKKFEKNIENILPNKDFRTKMPQL